MSETPTPAGISPAGISSTRVSSCPIFLINLDRDADRLVLMAKALAKHDLAFERIPAVFGVDMPEWIKPYFLDATGVIASHLRRGEIGCYASHLVVADHMVRQNIPLALVFEDDLAFPDDFRDLIAEAIRLAPEGWDIIRLSNPPKAAYLPLVLLPGARELVLYSRVPNNTGASLLSLAGARKLLRHGLRDLQIDEHLRRPWDLGMETYGIVPAPIRSNIFDTSTIDQIDERGLAGEGTLAKLSRRRIASPAMILAQIRWQLAHLGARAWLHAILIGVTESLRRKLAGKKAGSTERANLRLSSRTELAPRQKVT